MRAEVYGNLARWHEPGEGARRALPGGGDAEVSFFMTTPSSLSLVVFAFNEEPNVAAVLAEVLAWLRLRAGAWELLFVDDGSQDGTAAAAQAALAGEPRARLLGHERNLGIGAALKTGVRAATGDLITFLPCDGQIAPAELDILLAAAVRHGVPLVFSRYSGRDDGWRRALLSRGLRLMIRAVLGVSLRCEGPYLFERRLFDADRLPPDSFFLNFEFPIRQLRAGVPVVEVAIRCVPRRAGHSKSTGLGRIWSVARDLVDLRLRLARGL